MALNYTNPGWRDGNSPYINAANLNAISDNLQEATEVIGNDALGTTATTVTGAIAEHSTKIGSTAMNTTATTITGAIAEHESDVRKIATGDYSTRPTIPNNTNINNYKTAGVYSVSTDSAAATMTNLPRAASGELIVLNQGNTSYMTQIYIPTSDTSMIYIRTLYSNTWGAWSISANILAASISGNASAAGNFSYTFPKRCLVVSAYSTLSDTLVLPYPTSNTSTGGATLWWFHVQSALTGSPVSGSVSVTAFYIPLV